MKKNSQTTFFYLGDNKAPKSTGIYLYFLYYETDGKKRVRKNLKAPTPYKTNPKHWNPIKKQVISSTHEANEVNKHYQRLLKEEKLKNEDIILRSPSPDAKATNEGLIKIKDRANDVWNDLSKHQIELGSDKFKEKIYNAVRGKTKGVTIVNVDKEDLNKVFEAYLQELLNSGSCVPSTIVKYRNMKRLLDLFKWFNGKPITFESFDRQHYNSFQAYLTNEEHELPEGFPDKRMREKKKMKINSVVKCLKILKGFLKYAHKEMKCTKADHYQDFKIPKFEEKDIQKIALTMDDLEAIMKVNLKKSPELDAVRDFFLFNCFTGQRYNDIASLRWDDIKGDVWSNTDKKTGNKREVVLIPDALEILKKYKGLFLPLPKVSNVIVNQRIKIVAKLAGLTEKIKVTDLVKGEKKSVIKPKYAWISTHTARRTWITLASENGVRPEIGMEMTGHKDYRTYQKYNKVNTDMVRKEVLKAFA